MLGKKSKRKTKVVEAQFEFLGNVWWRIGPHVSLVFGSCLVAGNTAHNCLHLAPGYARRSCCPAELVTSSNQRRRLYQRLCSNWHVFCVSIFNPEPILWTGTLTFLDCFVLEISLVHTYSGRSLLNYLFIRIPRCPSFSIIEKLKKETPLPKLHTLLYSDAAHLPNRTPSSSSLRSQHP